MNTDISQNIFDIANKLRGPYRPPQYRKVMLPMTVLRRLDCVLKSTKDEDIKEYEALKNQGFKDDVLHKALEQRMISKRGQPLYNISPFTFSKLLGDPDNISTNLFSYINGFSKTALQIFEMFGFEMEIEKLDRSNRLFLIVQEFARIDLHPTTFTNMDMGSVFEELVRRFNEQANEEAGDHFTPREVIELMANIIYTEDEDVYKPGIVRTIYDPTCGTGGMLSVSEEYIKRQNPQAHLQLFGQEYNEESYAICCSDLLIKGEPVDKIQFGDTLGDGETSDGHPGEKFHYMLANPPFGVEWKPQKDVVEKEHEDYGFSGRFGPGLPRISDGSTLFLLHMMSKMHDAPEKGGEGSKIGIVFNGSPLFNGEAGPSESNIRRWIIENDWLDAIIALPDQMFYNTGILTYIWIVTNRKRPERKGKIQLIDATRHFEKMKKSLGNKRNKLNPQHIDDITRLYADFTHDDEAKVKVGGKEEKRVCSKIFDNRNFGFLKAVVERPLQLNFQASAERIERLKLSAAFENLAISKKRTDTEVRAAEIAKGKEQQQAILTILAKMDDTKLYMARPQFEAKLLAAFKANNEKLPVSIKKAILSALSERDPEAEICLDAKGNPEADSEIRDTEIIPLPDNISLPLPIKYGKDADNKNLLLLVKDHCEEYLEREVLPYVSDAWLDHSKTKVGYEIPINRHFYVYEPPRPLKDIENDIRILGADIVEIMLKGVT